MKNLGFKSIIIFTDGASRGNGSEDSIGAYGAVLQLIDNGKVIHKVEMKEAFKNVTNNQMELMAVIKALEALKFPCSATIFSDSKYVCDAINKGWLNKWMINGGLSSSKKPIANKELWERLYSLLCTHNITFQWVKGHSTNEGNIRADKLCNEAMDKFIKNSMN